MATGRKTYQSPPSTSEWRNYQTSLQQKRRRRRWGRLARWLLVGMVPVVVAICYLPGYWQGHRGAPNAAPQPHTQKAPLKPVLTRGQVRHMLSEVQLYSLGKSRFPLQTAGHHFTVHTTIDENLQQYLLDQLDSRYARAIAIVVMKPESGRIVAMVGYHKANSKTDPCLVGKVPAASVFKIVTAAGAIEAKGMNEHARIGYNGRAHTLYRSQLKNKNNRYTQHISLKKAFAKSINPVFGKLGAHYLGRPLLEQYASAFGFNRPIHFDQQMVPSQLQISDDPYHLAEIASGFNRSTRISPLHGAMMAAAILNGGRLITPVVVDRITNQRNEVVYTGKSETIQQAVRPETAQTLAILMKETVRAGTGRKIFRKQKRDKVLAKLAIGGKTGSLSTLDNDGRIDWFVGSATEKAGDEKLAISALVIHDHLIGIRAGEYVRMAIRQYFKQAHASSVQGTSKTKTAKSRDTIKGVQHARI